MKQYQGGFPGRPTKKCSHFITGFKSTGISNERNCILKKYQTVYSNNILVNQRSHPKLEVILSKEEPKNKTESFQEKFDEEKRKEIEEPVLEQDEEKILGEIGKRYYNPKTII